MWVRIKAKNFQLSLFILYIGIEINRGCDELETILFVKTTINKNKCRIFRINQIVNNELFGGYTVIAYNKDPSENKVKKK